MPRTQSCFQSEILVQPQDRENLMMQELDPKGPVATWAVPLLSGDDCSVITEGKPGEWAGV